MSSPSQPGSSKAGAFHTGRILIARPDFSDGSFDMTVTMLLEHNQDGAFGLILNRPSTVGLDETFHDWVDAAAEPKSLFAGGPVSPDSLIALGKTAGSGGELVHNLHTIDLTGEPLSPEDNFEQIRIYAGYAGWEAGQLERELLAGSWWLADGSIDDVFCPQPTKLWSKIMGRQSGELAWYAHYPADPTLN